MATILLVEDELELARVITRELEAAGFGVRHVADGETALRCLGGDGADSAPDVVVLDWMLPGIDGLEVLRRLRQHRHCRVDVDGTGRRGRSGHWPRGRRR